MEDLILSNTQPYVQQVYYSVIWKDTGKKYCDCGWESDAQNIVARRPHLLTYVKNDHILHGQTIDVTPPKQLPTNEIVVNMDGGVGGSWQEVVKVRELLHKNRFQNKNKQLEQSELKEFKPE